jgi:hypothetical protein
VDVEQGQGRAVLDLDLDLQIRLREVPATACARGIFFRVLEDDMARRGLRDRRAWDWETTLGEHPRSYGLYPVRRLLVAYADAARLVGSDPGEAVRGIFRGGCTAFSESWFGRGLKRVLAPDPLAALRWIERSRDHVCDYGRWRVEAEGAGRATIHMTDEHVWIDSAHRGGCEGLLAACGVTGEVTAELDDRFHGRLRVRWARG